MTSNKTSKLRFVTYTDCPAKQSKRDLKAVRSHVMHDYFNRQRPTPNDQDSPETDTRTSPSGASTPNAASAPRRKPQKANRGEKRSSSVTWVPGVGPVGEDVCQVHSLAPAFSVGCFQLERPKNIDDQSPEVRSTSRTPPRHYGPLRTDSIQSVDSLTSTQTSSTIESIATPLDADSHVAWSRKSSQSDTSSPQDGQLWSARHAPNTKLARTSPGPGPLTQLAPSRFDPFDQLPASGRNMDELISWHFQWPVSEYSVWEKQTPCLLASTGFYKRSLWEMTHTSKGLFHIFLCLADAKKAATTGQTDHVNYLYNRGKAIQELMACLREPKRIAPNSLATLASSMASLSLSDDGGEAALIHMKAAVGIIHGKTEGLSVFTETEWRACVWADLRVASAAFMAPMLPYAPRNQWANPPEDLRSESHRLAELSMAMMPEVDFSIEADTVHDIFQKLHQTCLIYDYQGRPSPPLMASHMNGFYWLEYQLCRLVSELCQLEGTGPEARVKNFTPGCAMLLVTQLFSWSCMPSQIVVKIHMPPYVNVVELRILRVLLRGLREQSEGDLTSFWQKHSRLESLIWVLIFAHRVYKRDAFGGEEMESWLLEELEHAGQALGYKSKSEYAEAFKCFPCTSRIGTPMWPGLGNDFAEWNPQLNRR